MQQEVLTPEAVAKRCMDSPGYVIFAAVLTNKKDARGFPTIDHLYRRYHFSFEDAQAGQVALGQFLKGDVSEFMRTLPPPE